MMHRKSIPRSKSNRQFRRAANRTHPFNTQSGSRYVMRGGIRM